jgi:hypothetical protein
MHTEKAKRNSIRSTPTYWYWAKRVVVFFFCLFALVFAWAWLTASIFKDYEEIEFKTSLDAALLSTAEYLLEHPQPQFKGLKFLHYNNGGGKHQGYPKSRWIRICIVMLTEVSKGDLGRTTEIYLNNSLIRFKRNGYGFDRVSYSHFQRFAEVQRCYDAIPLELGVHLVEVHMKYHPDDEPFHVHQWAFEIK